MLKVNNLIKKFGGLTAVNNLSFEVPENNILGLIGVNGSGKTTVLNCICGIYTPTSGVITLDDKDLTGLTIHRITHTGIGRTFQVPRLFNRMSLVDNLLVPVLEKKDAIEELRARALKCLETVNLGNLKFNHAQELSGGQQKLLEIARLMMFRPKLALLDEPFAGVNPSLCNEMLKHIENMLVEGMTFILVSHDLTSIYRLSDHILVLNEGRIIAEGDAEQVKSHPDVIEAYLGA